jgi:hypothetical protein
LSSTIAAVALLGMAALDCSNTNPASQTSGSGKTVSVAFSIKTNQEFNRVAASAVVTVTAPDMDSISQPMVITDSAMYATVREVPVGQNRLFQIFVYDSSYRVRYYGSQQTNIEPLVPTYVLIRLHKPTSGEVVVVGIIEDDTIPDTNWISVSQPWKAWPHVTNVTDPDTGAYVFSSGGAYCSNGDPVEYGFTFNRVGAYADSVQPTIWVSGEYVYHYLPYPGTYLVYVHARDAYNPSIESPGAGPVQVTAVSPYEIVLDTLAPPDTVDSLYYYPPDDSMPPYYPPYDSAYYVTPYGDTMWVTPIKN